jgi:transposase-like protein
VGLCSCRPLIRMHKCPHCHSNNIKKRNFYFVKVSRSKLRRYHCHSCNKTFSSKTLSPLYHQKKPFLNFDIYKMLMSGNTQRRTARLLNCSKNTVSAKLIWLSLHYKEQILSNSDMEHLQIDELETIEHTKLKPLTIPLCVNQNFKILGLSVGQIKAKGHLSEIALKKYGFREDQRVKSLTELFENLKKTLTIDPLTITTDSHPTYPKLVQMYFPRSKHIQIISRDLLKKKRELVYTAERKKVFDPLFAINQRCAMLRSDIRRLTRRSWCTTKKIENLRCHLELYKIYNNSYLAKAQSMNS